MLKDCGGGGVDGVVRVWWRDLYVSQCWRFPTDWFNVKTQFGAKGDGVIAYDGSVPSIITTGSSASAVSPTYTTNLANEMVLTFYALYGSAPYTGPVGSTARVAATSTGAVGAYENTATAPGAVGGLTLTQNSSAGFNAYTVPIFPTNGQTVSFVAASSPVASSTTNITPSVPAGSTTGMTMFALIDSEANVTTITAPAGNKWVLIGYVTQGGTSVRSTLWERTATNSEPANYTWTCTSTCNGGGLIVTYQNVGGIEDLLTSAGASFGPAQVGQLVCGDNTSCGTVPTGGVISPTKLVFGGMNNLNSALSSDEYRYATKDSAAFTAAMTAVCAKGGTLYIPSGNYGLDVALSCATSNYAVNVIGSGATFGNTHFLAASPTTNTTGLWWLSQSGTTTAFTTTLGGFNGSISGIHFYGGAGLEHNGWGSNGVNPGNGTRMSNVDITNFAGSCVYVGGGNSGLFETSEVLTQYCGLDGFQFDTTTMQNVTLGNNTQSQNNGRCGVNFTNWGTVAGNILLDGAIIQGNNGFNVANAGELCASQNMDGQVALRSTWLDASYPSSHSVINSSDVAFFAGTVFDQTYSVQSNSNLAPFTFSAAGTVLPACSARFQHTNTAAVCVTDAASYTVGATYTPNAGAGTDLEAVECNGTNWVQTGTSRGCN